MLIIQNDLIYERLQNLIRNSFTAQPHTLDIRTNVQTTNLNEKSTDRS